MHFEELVQRATGHGPYDYQRRVANEGLPELLRVPTGAGKTMAVILGWLHQRRLHPDTTPRRLVYVLPMRVLVEQVRDVAREWLGEVAPDVAVQVLMGGEGLRDHSGDWVLHPERETVLVGTLDMLLSRALNRGYGESRFIWPVAFGLLNSGTAWVFDEVQLMGPALPTSRQLEAFRRELGTALLGSSTWMSATVEESQLRTVDSPSVASTIELSENDRDGPLAKRLAATKTVRQLELDPKHRARSIAEALVGAHRPGTRTIAIMNTVAAAVELRQQLHRLAGEAEVVLLHSRFRPEDRRAHTERALAHVDPHGPGCIVVSTQVLEAGVDITSGTLFTEAAPWSSMVQRAGRCNREGEAHDASLLWAEPAKPSPYEAFDVASAAQALRSLEGSQVTPEDLGRLDVEMAPVRHPVLRRRDLVELFDTSPDLSGNDLDIGRYLRDGDDLDVSVAWWEVGGDAPGDGRSEPSRDERCPVPIGEVRSLLGSHGREVMAWRYDHLDECWVRCRRREDIRPGSVIVMRTTDGCYTRQTGWDPSSRTAVAELSPPGEMQDPSLSDTATSADPATFAGEWVSLLRHLEDVGADVRGLTEHLSPSGIDTQMRDATVLAGQLHDIGKAHGVFQAMLVSGVDGSKRDELAAGGPWAKSDHRGGSYPSDRRHFRHELASALALLGEGGSLLHNVVERDLVLYLVAAHHGRVRLGIRSLPEDGRPSEESERLAALGVWDGDQLPQIEVPGGLVPAQHLRLAVMGVGLQGEDERSWGELALGLRDRPDLGPFRVGFLEALVRIADWRVSAGKPAAKVAHDA